MLNNHKIKKIAALALLTTQMLCGSYASAQTPPDQIIPSQDGHWYHGGAAGVGSEIHDTNNYVGFDGVFGVERSALEFSLQGVTSNITKATLRIYITGVDSGSGFNPYVTLIGSTYGTWDGPFPMNNTDTPIAPYSNDSNITDNTWKEFDVTDFVRQQASQQHPYVTFALLGEEVNPAIFSFASDDESVNKPELVFEYPTLAPQVTPDTTLEDTDTSDGLVITPDPADTNTVTHYQISAIQGGTLYQSDYTPILSGDYITRSQGALGLRFRPTLNENTPAGSQFSFMVKAAKDSNGGGLSDASPAIITVMEANDPPMAMDDALSAVAQNSGERSIPFSQLLSNDLPGPANEQAQTMTVTSVGAPIGGTVRIEGSAVMFTPAANFHGTASFQYHVEDNGTTNGAADPKTAQGTVSFTVDAPADQPTVTGASTMEDTMTSSGLEITPTSAGGATTTHFKISEIVGGTLYQNDGTTSIQNGDFLTVSEGSAGLKFRPNANANGTSGFGFQVQAAPDPSNSLLSDPVQAQITVAEVNDTPTAQNDTLQAVNKGTPTVTIPFSMLTANDHAGPLNEAGQNLTVVGVFNPTGGTVSIANGQIEFLPNPSFQGRATFSYTLRDNGTTNGVPDYLTATGQVEFDVQNASQPVITLNGAPTIYLLKGQPYLEPGYSAFDDTDGDLTGAVSITGMVDHNVLGTYVMRYNVTDQSSIAAAEVTRTVQVVSPDLTALTVDAGTLTPTFDTNTTHYAFTVPNSTNSLSLSASILDSTATLTVNGTVKASGSASNIQLVPGRNDITIVVMAQGGTTKTYEVSVTREAASQTPPVTSPPRHTVTIPEQQTNLNNRAKEAIQQSTDAQWIGEQVQKSLDHLSEVVDPSNVEDKTKLELVTDTATNVFVPLIEKWKQGIISTSELEELLDTFLEDGVNQVFTHIELDDEQVFDKGKRTIDAVLETIISQLDDNQVKGSVQAQVTVAMNRLLDQRNVIEVKESATVDHVSKQLEQIATLVNDWNEQLADKADLFDLERHLLVQVATDSKASAKQHSLNRAATAESEPTVRFAQAIVQELADRKFQVTVQNEDGASMKVPTAFFTGHSDDELSFIVERNRNVTIPTNYAKASDAYTFVILANDKEITGEQKAEILIRLPYASKAKNLTPYYYDGKRKAWKQLTTSKGKSMNIEMLGETVQFPVTKLMTYMVVQTGTRSIYVDQRSLKLEQGDSQQVKVTGLLASGSKVDLSGAENGTSYVSSRPDVITVSADGLISVASDAKDGTKATITVKNGKSTAKISVTVRSLKKITVSPSKPSVVAGKQLQLKVYANYSDKTKKEITKEQAGTTYELTNDEYATITQNGLLKVSAEAPDKTEISVLIKHGDYSVTTTIIVKNR